MSENKEIIDVKWLNTRTLDAMIMTYSLAVGLVTVRDKNTDEIKTFIGVGKGFNEQSDAEYIADWGTDIAKFPFLKFDRNEV